MQAEIKTNKKKALIGRLLLFITTIIWGSSFIVLKDTLDALGGGHFTFFILACRFVGATAVLCLFGIKHIRYIDKNVFIKGFVLGLTLFGAYTAQTFGLKYSTASKNAFLTAAYCVMVPFMSWFMLKKRPEIKNYVAAILCFAGIAFVAFIGREDSFGGEFVGDMLTLTGAVFYALQIIFNARFVGQEDPISLLIVELSTVSVFFAALSGAIEFPAHHADFSIDAEAVAKIAYLAVFATCFAQFAQIVGQKYVPETTAALILTFESVFGVLFEILLGEAHITPFIAIGFAMIFLSETVSEVGLTPWRKLRPSGGGEKEG